MTDPMDSITNSIINNINGVNKKVTKYTDYKSRQQSSNRKYTHHNDSRGFNQGYRSQQNTTYNPKYRTGVDFRGLDWANIPKTTQGFPTKTIWRINDSSFNKKVNVSFDEMVRRYSLFVHKLSKNRNGFKNHDDYPLLKRKHLDTQINKILVMVGDDAEDKWEFLSNEFVLDIKTQGDLLEDVLDWKVDIVKSLNNNNETLFSFSNEIYCALVMKLFGAQWNLSNTNMYKSNLSNYEILEGECEGVIGTVTYKDKTLYAVERYNKEMIKNDITKNNIFYKFNRKYKSLNPTKILVLFNMVSLYDLKNEEKFIKIQKSLNDQKSNLLKGALNIIIPRPGIDMIFNDSDEYYKNGLTKVYIEFANVEDSCKAFENLDDWYFQDRKVMLSFYNEIDYYRGIYI
ncbi:hypothetical protein ACO0R3_001723 [Hanseniaspora guilliermondii]